MMKVLVLLLSIPEKYCCVLEHKVLFWKQALKISDFYVVGYISEPCLNI